MSEKSHLLLVDQQTLNHLIAGARALQMLMTTGNMSTDLYDVIQDGDVEAFDSDQLDTLAENLNTGFFEPEQADMLVHFHQPHLMPYANQVETNDELEVDDRPIFSEADDGVWVGAWVWVAKSDEADVPTD